MYSDDRYQSLAKHTRHYENVPFEVPEGWEWTVIEDVTVNRDAERIPLSLAVRKKQQNKVYDYYGAAGVIDKVENYLFDERLLLIGEDGANLLSRSKNNAFFAEGKYWVNNHAHVLDCPSKSVLDYVAFVVNSMSLDDYITGSAQPKLTQDNLNKILIPLPPEKEQHRIIESVNDYFSYISLLEDEIEEMNSFVQKAKSKILDLAIHGKLVPQDPNDEPAIELLKRINPKFTPCDNGHYENVPDSWFKVPLGNICTLNEGEPITDKEYPYIDVKGLRTGNYASKQSGKYVPAGTTLILVDGENSGEVFHTPEEGYQGSTMKVLDINNSMNVQYVLFFVKLYQKALRENKVGSAIPHLNKKMFRELVIPVPPIEEQERIVEAIEQYYRILDDISANL
ncbi:type I restriction enzyme, S subunit [Prevotella sp. tf2-5]|nr:type I restriction enzyme, S subunit [Prevotella sp. tf2-5]